MLHQTTTEGYQITFLHPEENIPGNTFTNKGTPTEVFVEPYYDYVYNVQEAPGIVAETGGSEDEGLPLAVEEPDTFEWEGIWSFRTAA